MLSTSTQLPANVGLDDRKNFPDRADAASKSEEDGVAKTSLLMTPLMYSSGVTVNVPTGALESE